MIKSAGVGRGPGAAKGPNSKRPDRVRTGAGDDTGDIVDAGGSAFAFFLNRDGPPLFLFAPFAGVGVINEGDVMIELFALPFLFAVFAGVRSRIGVINEGDVTIVSFASLPTDVAVVAFMTVWVTDDVTALLPKGTKVLISAVGGISKLSMNLSQLWLTGNWEWIIGVCGGSRRAVPVVVWRAGVCRGSNCGVEKVEKAPA